MPPAVVFIRVHRGPQAGPAECGDGLCPPAEDRGSQAVCGSDVTARMPPSPEGTREPGGTTLSASAWGLLPPCQRRALAVLPPQCLSTEVPGLAESSSLEGLRLAPPPGGQMKWMLAAGCPGRCRPHCSSLQGVGFLVLGWSWVAPGLASDWHSLTPGFGTVSPSASRWHLSGKWAFNKQVPNECRVQPVSLLSKVRRKEEDASLKARGRVEVPPCPHVGGDCSRTLA
ncbi:uncharacterized protein LOC118665880 isoform X2 [Myotis myotis]|uniref:uncharacterized protein LOC118665880 isoform X2 n=1 Tax=Myotis myotis TaxID=51298 RepID=UPI00174DF28C|nr:uncharacterized protein LOC118665880 isoform X2 [Myotis myotis]